MIYSRLQRQRPIFEFQYFQKNTRKKKRHTFKPDTFMHNQT